MLKIKKTNIIHHLHENKTSISELSDEIGVDKKTIYNILNKKNTPRLSLAQAIAVFFEKKIDDIFEFEEK